MRGDSRVRDGGRARGRWLGAGRGAASPGYLLEGAHQGVRPQPWLRVIWEQGKEVLDCLQKKKKNNNKNKNGG